jgi:hypothetical protein
MVIRTRHEPLQGGVAERLPAYARELNPVEALRSNLEGKGGQLANLTYPNLAGPRLRAAPT